MITSDLLNTFGITAVVRGSCSESSRSSNVEAQRYSEPKERGMMQCAPWSDVLHLHADRPRQCRSASHQRLLCCLGCHERAVTQGMLASGTSVRSCNLWVVMKCCHVQRAGSVVLGL